MLEAISVTEARKRFLSLMVKVDGGLYGFIVTKHGRPVAVIISYYEYSQIVETLKLSRVERLITEVRQGFAEIEEGKLIPLADVELNG